MTTVISNLKVKDYKTWKEKFHADAQRRTDANVKATATGEKPGEPGNVFVIFEVEDMSLLEKMMADPQLQAMMQESGVISKPEVIVME